ncbi:MAG: polysaccharide pyruvyl transferase CsaB [Cyanobacteria bacterium]|nr:polysaccharide pyruvyl transferase CsaB [Cyanobacteriota bacterium]
MQLGDLAMRVVLCGYYGMGNGGDEALLATLLQRLPPGVTPIVLSGNPTETRQRYGVWAVPRKDGWAVLRSLRSAQGFVWGGGSLMQDATSRWSPVYYGGLMLMAQALGLKTVAWGQGIGPLNRGLSRWLARRCFRGCTAVSVRDRPSLEQLQRWGRSDGLLAPDPVWALRTPDLVTRPHDRDRRVAVALRPHGSLSPARWAALGEGLARFQAQTDAHLVFLPFQPSRDRPPLEDLLPRLRQGSFEIIEEPNPTLLKAQFRTCCFAIAMRLHGAIAAAAEGCHGFALSYDPKVAALAMDLGWPGFDLTAISTDLPPFPEDPAAIAQAWTDAYRQGRPLSAQVRGDYRDRAGQHGDLLAQALTEFP